MDSNGPTLEKITDPQRSWLIACAVLSLVISLALVMNTFLGDRRAQVTANEEIVALQSALRENQKALVQTQQALQRETDANAKAAIMTRREAQLWLEWFSPRDKAHLLGVGAGVAVSSISNDRGVLNNGSGNQAVYPRDEINFRPVLRTEDGNARSVTITISGPGDVNSIRSFTTRPRVEGGDIWLYDSHQLMLPQVGTYLITVTGMVVWPSASYTVYYHLEVRNPPKP